MTSTSERSPGPDSEARTVDAGSDPDSDSDSDSADAPSGAGPVRRRGAAWLTRPPAAAWTDLVRPRLDVRSTLVDVAGLVAVVSALLLVWFQPWRNDVRVPLRYVNDGLQYAMSIKTMQETGWVAGTERLGAPFGQDLFDIAIGANNGNYLIFRALTLVSGDVGLVQNSFYFLGFVTVAVSAYVVARLLGVSRALALAIGVLYTFAPYHFGRAGHILLSHYAIVPIGVLVAVRAASGSAFVRRRPRSEVEPDPDRAVSPQGGRGRGIPAAVGWVLACVALASFGPYYFAFSLIVIAFMALVSAAVNLSVRPLLAAAGMGFVICVVQGINQLGTILYLRENGPNSAVGTRAPVQFDEYAFRLVQTLTPVPGTRVPLIGRATEPLSEGFASEPTMYFGLVGALCLVAMGCSWIVRIVGASVGDGRGGGGGRGDGDAPDRAAEGIAGVDWPERAGPLDGLLSVSTAMLVLVASAGGLSWFVLLADFDLIRAWGRSSIVMLFMVLVWAARRVDRWAPMRRRVGTGRPVLWSAGVALVCVVGVADQFTPDVAPPPGYWEDDYDADRDLFTQVEALLAPGAQVGQLPIITFPERSLNASRPYDPVRPFLHTDDIAFSYGGVRGRESDWQQILVDAPAQEIVDAFVSLGFDALLIDRGGYLDGGEQIAAELMAITGEEVLGDTNDKWWFLPIERDDSALADAELDELRADIERLAEIAATTDDAS